MRLTDRRVGFNVMEWGFILLMGRLAFYSVGSTIPYGSTESDFMTEVAVPLTTLLVRNRDDAHTHLR